MYQNIAFISTDSSQVSDLRLELTTLGLDFSGVRVNSKFHLMVSCNNLDTLKKLAKKYNTDKFYISDSRRALFEVTCDDNFTPTKLGTLKRSLSKDSSSGSNSTAGAFCLVVTEDNQTYYYEAQQ